MKNKMFLFTLVSLLLIGGGDIQARGKGKFWNNLKKFARNTIEVVGGAVLEQIGEQAGMTREEATEGAKAVYWALGLNEENVNKGMAFVNAEGSYQKANVISDYVFNEIEANTDSELASILHTLTSSQLEYLDTLTSAKYTDLQRDSAFNNRNMKMAGVMYDTYHYAKDRKAKYLSDKLKIERKLIENGVSVDCADDVAGSILAVRNSDRMTEQEKLDYYRQFGFTDDESLVHEVATEVCSMSEAELVAAEGPSPEEIAAMEAAKREEERLEKERLEREAAIASINQSVVKEYTFDTTDLTDEQKATLYDISDKMLKYPDLNLLITGHTCNKGYKSVNMRVGLRRAESAKQYIVGLGVDENRVKVDSKGEESPIVKNSPIENRKFNRRLEFKVE